MSLAWQSHLTLLLLLLPLCSCENVAATTAAPAVTTTTFSGSIDPLSGLAVLARNVVLLISLLALTLIVNNYIQKRQVPIPEAICTVIIGVIAGGVVGLAMGGKKVDIIEKLEDASATQFMIAFIAPIIFAEGYGLKSRQFFDNISRICVHALLGTLVSTIIVGLGIYYMPRLTGVPDYLNYLGIAVPELSLPECFAFGALISATDPVTTLAIFKDQQMVENGLSYLYYSVLGESILNDAVGLTLFAAFGDLVKKDEELSLESCGKIALTFCYTFIGSLAIGVFCGVLTALILKHARLGHGASEEEHYHFNVPELGLTLVLAYLPFLLAEAIDFSGIVAVMFAGVAMRQWSHYNMTRITRQVFLPTIELLASMSETYVFLLLGLGVFLLKNAYSPTLIFWSFVFILVGRAAHVYPFSWVINKCSRSRRLSMNEQHVICFAGLRGAIAFMCALSFPLSEKNPVHQHRDIILCTTVIIIIVTMLCFGWPTTSALRLLDIKQRDDSRMEINPNEVVDEAVTQSALEQQGDSNPEMRGGEPRLWKHATFWLELIQRILMTDDAIIERAENNLMATALRSQRESGALARPSNVPPSQSSHAPFININPHGAPEDSGRLSEAARGRPSGFIGGRKMLPPGVYTFGVEAQAGAQELPTGVYSFGLVEPQIGLPSQWAGNGGLSVPLGGAAAQDNSLSGRPSTVPSGRPSAAPSGRPSDGQASQGLASTSTPGRFRSLLGSEPRRSGRMLCNP